jgi:hypothetical protein
MVIEKLLTDENLRIRFALDRMETVAELYLRGFDLSSDEIDLFCRADAALWFLGDTVREERQQSGCALHSTEWPAYAEEV